MTEEAPDFAILIAAAWRALTDELQAAMHAEGLDVRPSFGFVIRAVAAEEPSISRLAELLGVTKQAASQFADEVEHAGLIERFDDPDDRRRRRLRLTSRGLDVRSIALRRSEALEQALAVSVGEDAVRGCRAALTELVARNGGQEDELARRARMVEPR
jgi:DNA-binding MarR family transcriptional regulator